MASVNLQEKAYFTRLSRLLVDKGTEALRNTLDTIHPPAHLSAVLNANRSSLLKLKPRVINDSQWDLLFPLAGNPPDSKTFDVTLLTVLFRNICGLLAPVTGWNTMPPHTDNSPQASITRIKLYRNQVYAHAVSTQVDLTTFEDLWQKISKTLVDLNIPQKEVDDLKLCPLCPEEQTYVKLLKEWFLADTDCKNMLDDLMTNVKLVHNEIKQSGLQRASGEEEQLLQKLAKHNFNSKIRSKVKLFHPSTRDWVLKKVDNWFTTEDESRLLLLTAGPGFGKSVFAAKVCELFKEKGKLGACHFCDFSSSNLKDPKIMLQSLASQMCQNVFGFKEKLLDQLKRPHEIHGLKDTFEIYLQNPLDELEGERSLIVIDGLDESATDEKSDMVKLIADNFPDLPGCVKVLVTSRPELSIQRLKDQAEMIEINEDDQENELDILEYLKVCLPHVAAKDATTPHSPSRHDNVLSAIVEKCEGSFLYAFHVQRELRKRENLDTMTFEEVMSFVPTGMGSVYQEYFHRLEIELEAVMNRNPDLFKLLELLVAIDRMEAALPLKFLARALDLALDCRETKRILNKVNETVSCLLYVSDDLITVFHKSVYDWLLASGYKDHEYTVKVSDGKKRLWLVCEQVFIEIKRSVILGQDVKLTNDVKHALEYGPGYLLSSNLKDSFSWLVDMIIIHILSTVYPKSLVYVQQMLEEVLQRDVAISLQLRQRISWHFIEISFLRNHEVLRTYEFKSERPFSYLECVLDHSPEGCFTDSEKKIAEDILAKFPRCAKSNSVQMKRLKPLLTKLFPSPITAVGVCSNKKLAAVALDGGVILILTLPELVKLWQYSTEYGRILCCTFAPDDTFVLYGKLETVLSIAEKKEVSFFNGKVERFKSCAFSPNRKKLVTTDGSNTIKLWDVVRKCLVANLCTGVPVDCCTFSTTGLFIIGDKSYTNKDAYCVWNSITLQRVDQRSSSCNGKLRKNDEILRSERCNRCVRQEFKELTPPKGLGVMTSLQLKRYIPYIIEWSLYRTKYSKTSTAIYNERECIIYLYKQQFLRVMESIHFTTLASWEVCVANFRFVCEEISFVDITVIEDSFWLYGDRGKLVVFSSVPPKENQLRPTCVLWCSFSPDGTRLASCTSDGFINLWNVETSQLFQRFRSNLESSSTTCWWSEHYLFVCHLFDKIPSLSRYRFDENIQMMITLREPVPLSSVANEFLPFSGFLDFSEGCLSFECGRTKPVKVLDVRKMGNPKMVTLPGIMPMMSIAISANASFVLAAVGGYFLWKKNEDHPSVYDVFMKSVNLPIEVRFLAFWATPVNCECRFSNDSKLAVVSYIMCQTRTFVVIDLDSGVTAMDDIQVGERPPSYCVISKVFCTNTVVIFVSPHLIEIFDLESWKRLGSSFQRFLTKDLVVHSKLSPKGTALVFPTLRGEMQFLQLRIPEYSSVSSGVDNWKRLGGFKSLTSGDVTFFWD